MTEITKEIRNPKEQTTSEPEKKEQPNAIKKVLSNYKNALKNYKKVKASPYASLTIALTARKIIIGLLIPFILWLGYGTIKSMPSNGIAGTISKAIGIGVIIYIVWKLYSTIPMAKKQIEYYKKYPHVINYCPTDVKETVDSILNKFDSKGQIKREVPNGIPSNKKKSA
jgi:hypothetical protein